VAAGRILAAGSSVRSALIGFLVIVAAGCSGGVGTPHVRPLTDDIQRQNDRAPLMRVSVDGVTGLVPGGWTTTSIERSSAQHGFIASPSPHPFAGATPRTALTAAWIDASEVGVSSDLFYLAARGPLLSGLFGTDRCRVRAIHVFIDREPTYLAGIPGSPGDFVASGHGMCESGSGLRHAWSYFVAAPGFGPIHQRGITRSGLYVAAAITRATPHASTRLRRLLDDVRFGPDGIDAFIGALRVA